MQTSSQETAGPRSGQALRPQAHRRNWGMIQDGIEDCGGAFSMKRQLPGGNRHQANSSSA
jgi:hypothetical protein